jgi:hypothetical protein
MKRALSLILLLAAAALSATFDRTLRVGAQETQGLQFQVHNRPGTLHLQYGTSRGGSPVRVFVIPKADQARLLAGREVPELSGTDYGQSGSLQVHISTPGEYVAVVDNRAESRQGVTVRVFGAITYDPIPVEARELPPSTRMVVIAITTVLFLGTVWFAGRPVWAAMTAGRRRRWPLG